MSKTDDYSSLRLLTEIACSLKDISKKISYLSNYWYDLKLYTHSFHGIYRFYYKILLTFGNKGMAVKCEYHDFIHGSGHVSQHLTIFKYLVKFVDIQNELIGAFVRFSSNMEMLNEMALLIYRVNCFIDMMMFLKQKILAFSEADCQSSMNLLKLNLFLC